MSVILLLSILFIGGVTMVRRVNRIKKESNVVLLAEITQRTFPKYKRVNVKQHGIKSLQMGHIS